jgi:hypothetical protein
MTAMFGRRFLFACILVATGSLVHAQKDKKPEATLTFLKSVNNSIFFSVDIQNPKKKKMTIVVQDENGRSVMKSEHKKKKLNRILQAPLENGRLTVMVVDEENATLVGYYEINPASQLVEEVLVSKID